jgi:hypothetical protein
VIVVSSILLFVVDTSIWKRDVALGV